MLLAIYCPQSCGTYQCQEQYWIKQLKEACALHVQTINRFHLE